MRVCSFPWRQWHPTPVLLPGKSHGRRSLEGCSSWGREESDTTERLHSDFSLSCIGEGNGNPLQHSCLENPRDGGAWWAAIYGVAQSRTRLKRLSSMYIYIYFFFFFLLRCSWLTVLQVHSKVIQLYKYMCIIFEIIFHHRVLHDIDYGSLWYALNLCCISIF